MLSAGVENGPLPAPLVTPPVMVAVVASQSACAESTSVMRREGESAR
jgi:hypothetical protein